MTITVWICNFKNHMPYFLQNWICRFEKPRTEPNSLHPSTTVLSPYLKFGCLSARTFYYRLLDVYRLNKVGWHSLLQTAGRVQTEQGGLAQSTTDCWTRTD